MNIYSMEDIHRQPGFPRPLWLRLQREGVPFGIGCEPEAPGFASPWMQSGGWCQNDLEYLYSLCAQTASVQFWVLSLYTHYLTADVILQLCGLFFYLLYRVKRTELDFFDLNSSLSSSNLLSGNLHNPLHSLVHSSSNSIASHWGIVGDSCPELRWHGHVHGCCVTWPLDSYILLAGSA